MSELREECQHRWSDIYKCFGMTEQFISKRHGPCPMCGGTDRGRMTDFQGNGSFICNQCCPESIDGIELLVRHTGQGFKELAGDIREILGTTTARIGPAKDIEKAKARLRKIWADSKPLTPKCPTHLYLHNRGLSGIDYGSLRDIRCHSGLTYWESGTGKDLGKHPAMIGLVTTPDGMPATIHCTYLTPAGQKIEYKPARKIMTPSRDYGGGAIRLQTLGKNDILCVAEGIETALAMKLLFPDLVPWACLDAGNMTKFQPPADYRGSAMYIAADNDVSYTGQSAAYALAKKLSGKFEVSVLMPEKQGTDFLQEYNSKKQVSA